MARTFSKVALALALSCHAAAAVSVRRNSAAPDVETFQEKIAKFAAAVASTAPAPAAPAVLPPPVVAAAVPPPSPPAASFQDTLTRFVKDAAKAEQDAAQAAPPPPAAQPGITPISPTKTNETKDAAAAPPPPAASAAAAPVVAAQAAKPVVPIPAAKLAPVPHVAPIAPVAEPAKVAPVAPRVIQAPPKATPQVVAPQAAPQALPQSTPVEPAAHVNVVATHPKHGNATSAKAPLTIKHSTSIFHALLRDWKEVPQLPVFVARCTTVLNRLLPELRREYTMNNVPKVLLHECDVYTTTEDYILANKTNLVDARASCRYAARRLGVEYLGDQEYHAWCTDLHEYLEEQSTKSMRKVEADRLLKEQLAIQAKLDKLRKDYSDMMSKRGHIGRELDSLGRVEVDKALPCCPFNCQMCSL